MTLHNFYMQRCLQLAALGAGYVAPNPMVGAVLVYNNTIIGEGYHQQYGKAHAEVNCLSNVAESNRHLISQSTLYVSLEPCAHFGKTPPCANLIIQQQIPRVVVGCRDPFLQVNGKGIDILVAAGVAVETGVLEAACKALNKRFFTFHTLQRPYIVLKWAQSANQKIAAAHKVPVKISNHYSNRLVHKWRGEEAGILVGTQTAETDDPQLGVRHWTGQHPTRLVLDMNLRLPATLQLFNKTQPTVVFNAHKNVEEPNLHFLKLHEGKTVLQALLDACYQLNIISVLVEGGTTLLQSMINDAVWDEARIVQNNRLILDDGFAGPFLTGQRVVTTEHVGDDTITSFANIQNTYMTY